MWESSPGWGYDIQVDQVREIELRRIDPATGEVSNGPGTDDSDGVIPIPLRSYERPQSQVHAGENRMINMTPSNPRLVRAGGDLVCTFRMVHPIKVRPYVDPDWIVDSGFNRKLPYRDSDLSRDSWTMCVNAMGRQPRGRAPQRVSESEDYDKQEVGNEGFSHHQYGLAEIDGNAVVACHCFNNYQYPQRNHRVEVLSVNGGDLPPMHRGVKTHGRTAHAHGEPAGAASRARGRGRRIPA